MAKGGVRVDGLNRKVRQLQQLGVAVEDLKDAFAAIAAEGAERIAALAPKRSGRLAADVRGNRAKGKAVVRAGRAAVAYAGPVNYGWPARGIEPALFMQEGDKQMQPIAIARLEDEIERVIRKTGLK